MFTVLLTLLIIVAIMMIGVILLQKSEGSGMSGQSASNMFAGIMTGAGAGNFLTKLTAILATIFFVLCILLAVLVSKQGSTRQMSELRSELVGPKADMGTPVSPEVEKLVKPVPEN